MGSKKVLELIEHMRTLGYTPPPLQRQEDLFNTLNNSMKFKFIEMINKIQLENIVKIVEPQDHHGSIQEKNSDQRKNFKLPSPKAAEKPRAKVLFPQNFKKREELIKKKADFLLKYIQKKERVEMNKRNKGEEVADQINRLEEEIDNDYSHKSSLVHDVKDKLKFKPKEKYLSKVNLEEVLKFDKNLLAEAIARIHEYNNAESKDQDMNGNKPNTNLETPKSLALHFERLRCSLSETYRVQFHLNMSDAAEENVEKLKEQIEMEYKVYEKQNPESQIKLINELIDNFENLFCIFETEVEAVEHDIVSKTLANMDNQVSEILEHECYSKKRFQDFITNLSIPLFSQKSRISLITRFLNEEESRAVKLSDALKLLQSKYLRIVELENTLKRIIRRNKEFSPDKEYEVKDELSLALSHKSAIEVNIRKSFIRATTLIKSDKNENNQSVRESLLNYEKEYDELYKTVKESQNAFDDNFAQKFILQIENKNCTGKNLIDQMEEIYRGTGNIHVYN